MVERPFPTMRDPLLPSSYKLEWPRDSLVHGVFFVHLTSSSYRCIFCPCSKAVAINCLRCGFSDPIASSQNSASQQSRNLKIAGNALAGLSPGRGSAKDPEKGNSEPDKQEM